MHWLKKEELKLVEFLKNPEVRKATTNEYFDFLTKFFEQAGKLSFYTNDYDCDILITDENVRIPNLQAAVSRKILVKETKLSRVFNSKAYDIGDNIIYNMSDGSIDGYNKISISKNILTLLKVKGFSIEAVIDLFYDDKELPESLRGQERRGLNKLINDYSNIDITIPVGLKRDLPLRKRMDF